MNKKLIVLCVLLAIVLAAPDVPAPTTAACPNVAGSLGYYWSNDSCVACAANCASCTAPWGCSQCLFTYQRVSTTDETAGCYKPQSTQPDGTTTNSITNTLGTSCAQDCADLSGKTIGCVLCSSGFGVQANACAACPANCATCTFAAATGAGTCTKCSAGFYMNASSVCTACPTTLTNCLQCDATGATCALCNSGFFNSGANGTCVACDATAATCDASGKILTCKATYFLDTTTPATPKCTACGTGCVVCTSATACTTCTTWSGFYLAAGVCTACPQTNAMFCTATAVIQCKAGYAIVGNTCVAQIANCIKHTSDTVCATCRTGYVFHQSACTKLGSGTISLCSAATSATAVSTNAVCTTCTTITDTTLAGKINVIDATTKLCVACPDYATACTSTGGTFSALTCGTGYVQNLAGTACISCNGIKTAYCQQNTQTSATKPKCIKTGTTACAVTAAGTVQSSTVAAVYDPTDSCDDGYFLTAATGNEGSICTACNTGCKTCIDGTSAKCLSCFPGYAYDATNGTCTKCANSSDSGCSSTCASPKRKLLATTTEWVATVVAVCQIITDSVTKANGVQDATSGKVTSCNNGYQLSAAGNTNAGSCILCSAASTGATDCNTCTGTATNTAYVCTACATATNTLQGTATVLGCAADTNCAQIVSSKCVLCKFGYNVDATGKCTACTGACTFSCPIPPPAGSGSGAGSGSTTTKANSGSFLTFAFSAIVLILAALF